MKRRRKRAGSIPQPANRSYSASPQELVETLRPEGEWPEAARGSVLAKRTRKQKNPSGERAAAAHDVVLGLLPYLSPSEGLELFLDETRSAPRPIDREGRTQATVRRSGRTRIRLTGRLSGGQAFKLEVSHERKVRRAGGHYQEDYEGESRRWVPGKVSESWKTQVELRVGLSAEQASALHLDELAWLMNLPTWVKDSQLRLDEETLVLESMCHGIPLPGEFAEWVVAPVAALATQRRAPSSDSESIDPEVEGIFQNLVLAALVDGRLDPGEVSFLSARARWLGLSTEVAQRLASEVTSGQVTDFYRPEDPVAGRVTFRQIVQALYADGELSEREGKLIRFLARGLDINQGDLAQALGEVAPGPHWEFLASSWAERASQPEG